MIIYATKIEPLNTDLSNILCLLDEDRKSKINRIKVEEARLHSIYSGLLLRYAFLQNYQNNFWNKIHIEYTDNGKPFIKEFPDFNYSISHSGGYVVLATDSCPVGIDLQEKKEYKESIANRFFTIEESNFLNSLPMKEQSEYFYKLWSMKEACSKISGEGIAEGATRYTFKAKTIKTQNMAFDIKTQADVYLAEYTLHSNYSCTCASRSNTEFPKQIQFIQTFELTE